MTIPFMHIAQDPLETRACPDKTGIKTNEREREREKERKMERRNRKRTTTAASATPMRPNPSHSAKRPRLARHLRYNSLTAIMLVLCLCPYSSPTLRRAQLLRIPAPAPAPAPSVPSSSPLPPGARRVPRAQVWAEMPGGGWAVDAERGRKGSRFMFQWRCV